MQDEAALRGWGMCEATYKPREGEQCETAYKYLSQEQPQELKRKELFKVSIRLEPTHPAHPPLQPSPVSPSPLPFRSGVEPLTSAKLPPCAFVCRSENGFLLVSTASPLRSHHGAGADLEGVALSSLVSLHGSRMKYAGAEVKRASCKSRQSRPQAPTMVQVQRWKEVPHH